MSDHARQFLAYEQRRAQADKGHGAWLADRIAQHQANAAALLFGPQQDEASAPGRPSEGATAPGRS